MTNSQKLMSSAQPSALYTSTLQNASHPQKSLNISDIYNGFELINVGSYGQIYSAKHTTTNRSVVLKKVAKEKLIERSRILVEIEAGIALHNRPGISNFLESFETENSYWLVFERIEGCDLFQYMKESNFTPLPEKLVKKIAQQLVEILMEVHKKGFAHKDIKLENVMYNSATKKVTLIDFGLSARNQQGYSTDFAGSREYSPPEILSRKSFLPAKADVWSLGVTLFALLYGVFPFCMDSKDYLAIREGFGRHPPPCFPKGMKVSSAAQDFLTKMLELNPDSRMPIEDAIHHPWLSTKRKAFLFLMK